MIQGLLRSLERYYFISKKQGFALILARWKELSGTLGQKIRIPDGSETEGEIVGLDEDGALLIRKTQGGIFKKTAGDIQLIR